MKPNRKRVLKFGVVLVVVYLLSFIVLWLGGGYAASRSGRTREHILPTGYPILDTVEWQPLIGNCQPNYQWPGSNADWSNGPIAPKCDTIGWAYYPLWLLVKSKYPTYALMEKDALSFDTIDPQKLPHGFKFHPLRRKELDDGFSLMINEAVNKPVPENPH
jgi:hypothetical protein